MSELVVSAILHYTSCPEVADEHSKEWIAGTVKEIITEICLLYTSVQGASP